MIDYYTSQIELHKKKINFTIPTILYIDKEYNYNRRSIILLIADILQKNKKFKNKSRKDQDDIIIKIELSCFNHTINKSDKLLIYKNWDNSKFLCQYQLSCNKVTKNLDIESEVNSCYLIDKVIDGKIDLDTIAELSSDKLCPDKSNNIKENLSLRNQQKLHYKTSTLYKCSNCGKKETILKQIQIKSLDEGFSTSLTCIFCNKNWVIS